MSTLIEQLGLLTKIDGSHRCWFRILVWVLTNYLVIVTFVDVRFLLKGKLVFFLLPNTRRRVETCIAVVSISHVCALDKCNQSSDDCGWKLALRFDTAERNIVDEALRFGDDLFAATIFEHH